MIKNRNMGDFLLELSVPGVQTTTATLATGAGSGVIPFAGRLSAILARLQVAGTTGTQNVDIFKNGVSLTGGSGLFHFASAAGGNTAPTYVTSNLTSNPVLVAKGDVLSCVNKTIHTTAANDLSIYLTLERQRIGTFDDTVQTDTIGSDSDVI